MLSKFVENNPILSWVLVSIGAISILVNIVWIIILATFNIGLPTLG